VPSTPKQATCYTFICNFLKPTNEKIVTVLQSIQFYICFWKCCSEKTQSFGKQLFYEIYKNLCFKKCETISYIKFQQSIHITVCAAVRVHISWQTQICQVLVCKSNKSMKTISSPYLISLIFQWIVCHLIQ